MIKTDELVYSAGEIKMRGFFAYDDSSSHVRPVILVAHDWSGRSEFACTKAKKLAELGYVGFAMDLFGNVQLGETTEEKMALIQPLLQNRPQILKRMLAAIDACKNIAVVDGRQIGAIGFCFGGLCVLDLARSNAENVKAVVSFHGLLNAPEGSKTNDIEAKVLVLHGFNDPMVTHDAVIAFGKEMTKAKADWQLNMYGNAMHAFMNPKANDMALGTVYNKKIESRAWAAMQYFLEETFEFENIIS